MGDCIEEGKSILIENLDEMIDATLGPVIGRNSIKRGEFIRVYKLGSTEYTINKNFRLIMHTKLSNPHYPPEIQAETTLINFTVTEDGLGEQLLSLIVKLERPKLAAKKEEVIQSQNEGKIKLRQLEEYILESLNTSGDLLENKDLIGGLENSKVVSEQVSIAMAEAKKAEEEINISSELYRSAATRGSLIFFLMTELYKLHSFYLYSLESYIFVIQRAIKEVAKKWRVKLKEEEDKNKTEEEKKAELEKAQKEGEQPEKVEEDMPDNLRLQRVQDLVTYITEFSFFFVRRGLFEKHKLIFSTLLCFRILLNEGKIKPLELKYLMEGKKDPDVGEILANTKEYLNSNQVMSSKALEVLPGFEKIIDSLTNLGEVNYWKKWLKDEKAETGELPKSISHLSSFQKLLLIRALRPDRIISAVSNYIIEMMTDKYIEQAVFRMNETYNETNKLTPIFFVLFPGIDPTKVLINLILGC
jgi:dynein heavy chain, axonemal